MAGGPEQLSAHPSGRPEDAATGVEQTAGPRPPGVFRGAHRPTGATSLANLLARTGDDLRADTVLAMQRTAGNHAVTRALAPPIATTAMAVPAERSLQGLTPAHGPRGLGSSSVLARQGTKQIDKPGGEKAKGTASAAELAAESEMLALLEGKVTASDTAEQKRRVDRLGEVVAELPFWQAESIQARLSKPKPEDRLATEFKHRLSTETREVLLGRLSARVATKAQFFSPQQDPREDPKYIDNVLEEVRCWLIVADRYTVVYAGGRKVVPNADIDWQKSSTALPIVTIQSDEAAARAAATEWHDVAAAGKYDRAVAFYHGPGGVVLPTWFSPETAPATYRLIMGVNASVRQEALSIAEEFRKLRNSMIIGAIAGGVLKFAVRMAPGGGGIRGGGGGAPPSSDPIPDPLPESAGTTADPVGGTPKGGSSTTGNVKAPDVSTGSAP